MAELSASTRAVLRQLQEEDSPEEVDRQRVRAGLVARLGVGAAAAGATVAVTKTAAAVTTGALFKAGVVASLVVGVSVAAYVVPSTPAPAGSAPSAVAPKSSSPPAVTSSLAKGELSETTDSAAAPPESSPEEVAAPEAQPAQKTQRSKSSTTSLTDEAELLRRAHTALRRGQSEAAIRLLGEHRRRFPGGTLRLEREAAWAIAECQSGNHEAGRSRALAFRRAHPSSPMVGRLEAACRLTPP